MATLVLLWAMFEQDRLAWRGFQIDGDLCLRTAEVSRMAVTEVVDVLVLDRHLEAALDGVTTRRGAGRIGLRRGSRRTPISISFRDATP